MTDEPKGGEFARVVGNSACYYIAIGDLLEIEPSSDKQNLEEVVSILNAAFRARLDAEVKELTERVSQLEAEGYACGKLQTIDGVFSGGCGQHVDREEAYRCCDCTASFHRKCIRKHFKSTVEDFRQRAKKHLYALWVRHKCVSNDDLEAGWMNGIERAIQEIRSLPLEAGEEKVEK